MRITSSGVYTRPQPAPKMPTGLVELMEDLTKDVLKHNPPNLYEFCANHMHQLLIVRDGHAPKQQLTLDQKIRKAQDTVKDRAAKRRHKYDEEMKKINELLKQTEVQSNDCQISADKEETPKDLITDTNNLKAPVHHDQDLAKALEVEIFHKPLAQNKDVNGIEKQSFENTDEDISKSELTTIQNTEMMQQHIEMEPTEENKLETQTMRTEKNVVQDKKDLEKVPTKEIPNLKGFSSENNEENSTLNETATDSTVDLGDKETELNHATCSENKEVAKVHEEIQKDNAIITDKNTNISDLAKLGGGLQTINNDANDAKELDQSNVNNDNTEVDIANDKKKLEAVADNISNAVQTTEMTNEIHDVGKQASHDFEEVSIETIPKNHADEPKTVENRKPDLLEPSKNNTKTEQILLESFIPTNAYNATDESTHNKVDVQKFENENAEKKGHEKIDESGKSDTQSEFLVDESKVNSTVNESVFENNETDIQQDLIDDTNTNVDTILVDESADIKNDKESTPGQTIEEVALKRNEANLNDPQNILENDTETLEHDNGNPDRTVLKSDEIIHPTHDDKSIKLDCSIGKSSIDGSFIEEGNHNCIEQETAPSNSNTKDYTSSMDLETAAVTIQKVFRTFMFKSRGSTFDDTGVEDANFTEENNEKVQLEYPMSTTLNKDRRALGISRMDTVLQTVNEEKSLSLSTDDSSLSSAATIIQAHVRGFLVRNKLNSNKTNSASLINSDGLSTSLEMDSDQKANKTILNIHIVPEGDNFLSRDESLLTSIDLSLDGSPPSSTNLHPLGYDKSEPRKQLKREDAIQSISPPSNNSGKLSEDVESVKDMNIFESEAKNNNNMITEPREDTESRDDSPTRSTTIETVIEAHPASIEGSGNEEQGKGDTTPENKEKITITTQNSDENDVITPYDEERYSIKSDDTSQLLHSGEFHDIVLPTKVSRSDTSVVRGE